METNEFQKFLENQKIQKLSATQPDWSLTKQIWIEQANNFVEQVKGFLTEFSPDITCSIQEVDLSEDHLGNYSIPKLIVSLPNEQVEFIPIGALLIGAHGRYDLVGPGGRIKWVLVPENAEKPEIKIQINTENVHNEENDQSSEKLVWKLATPPPSIRYHPISKGVLLEAIMEVSNG